MSWIKRMNATMDYIEENLENRIDYEKVALISACPSGLFQRMFSNLTGTPLSEYIRRRKLSKAAFELQTSKTKVIDVAIKYGYETSDSFSVAFKKMHGVAPSVVAKGSVVLKSFPKMKFKVLIEGASEMNYKIVEKESFFVKGKSKEIYHSDNKIPQFWDECRKDGTMAKICEKMEEKQVYGICYGAMDGEKFNYMIGVKSSEENGELERIEIPKSTWAVFESVGPMPNAIKEVWKKIFSEFLPESVYKHAGTPDMEVYPEGDITKDDYVCEIWIPIVKK